MTIELTETVFGLIEKSQKDTTQIKKKYRPRLKVTVLQKNTQFMSSNKLDIHKHQRNFQEKKIYEKPWLITKKSNQVTLKNQKSVFSSALENVENETDEFNDLPKDPVILGRINFRKRNILEIKNSQPPEPKERYVDSRFGDAYDLKNSGLIPFYLRLQKKFKKSAKGATVKKTQKSIDIKKSSDCLQIDKTFQSCRHVTKEEREELLINMQKRWDELMKEFQTLPFVIDTPPLMKKKSRMENDLQQLEKDIDIIKRHSHIFVYEDNEI